MAVIADELGLSDEVKAAFSPILKQLPVIRQALIGNKEVVHVRPGYGQSADGQSVPCVVVAVVPGTAPVRADELAHQFNVAVQVAGASVEEQIDSLKSEGMPQSFSPADPRMQSAFERMLTGAAEPSALEFAAPRTGAYEPLDPPQLPLVDEEMEVTVFVSPEAGWGELEKFLGETEEQLTVAMYQFTAPHIFQAVLAAVKPAGRKLKLVLHPIPETPPKSGVKANDLHEEDDVLAPLHKALGKRFSFSWATLHSTKMPEGQWASAYHIKVAVRDGKTVWVCSGNWQSSNQPDVHPFAKPPGKLPPGFQRKYNRDYHAIIHSPKVAGAFETYIERDFDLTAGQGKPVPFALPELFVPVEGPTPPPSFAAAPEFFPPLKLNKRIKVQPLLTPDNYAEHVLALIDSAQESVWFQNQYITFRNDGEDFPIFKRLVMALKKKIDKGLDVRIICRDMMKQESVDVLTALGFPRETLRFQPACHNKTIIVDRKVVLFGSHNWSNEGVSTNRDASLIFDDEQVADYLAEVFDYDWRRLATAKPTPAKVRVARAGEATPAGFEKVPFSAVFED